MEQIFFSIEEKNFLRSDAENSASDLPRPRGTYFLLYDRFVSVSDHLCPLNIAQLEAFLPAPTPPPTLHTWDVYAELQKIKPSKACGPDGISPKLVKEFSYEFSTPLTDLLNCSFSEGVVPKQWKRAVVVPIPKTHPPREDKLCPVSLTDCFAKVSEGFITILTGCLKMLQIK